MSWHADGDRDRGRHMESDYQPPAARGCGLEAALQQLALHLEHLQRDTHGARAAQPSRMQVFAESPSSD